MGFILFLLVVVVGWWALRRLLGSPREFAAELEVRRRARIGEQIINEYRLNEAAIERLRQQGRL